MEVEQRLWADFKDTQDENPNIIAFLCFSVNLLRKIFFENTLCSIHTFGLSRLRSLLHLDLLQKVLIFSLKLHTVLTFKSLKLNRHSILWQQLEGAGAYDDRIT